MSEQDLDKQDNGLLVPFERWMGRVGMRLVPATMSANQVTLVSGACALAAALAFYLASFHPLWFALAALLVLLHWAADNVDGHVARARNQCSQAGRFLDIFFDATGFAALGIGLACADYTLFPVVAVATMLCLLQYVLTVLWIALTRIWPFPVFGPAEASLALIVMALLMLVLPAELLVLGGRSFSLIDIGFVLTIPSSLVTLWVSARALYRHLQCEAVAASAEAVPNPAPR